MFRRSTRTGRFRMVLTQSSAEIGQARLVDRHGAAPQRVDLDRVRIDAGDDVPEIRQKRPRHQTNIPAPNHRNPHESPISVSPSSLALAALRGIGNESRRLGLNLAGRKSAAYDGSIAMDNPVLVEVTRGPEVESQHHAAAAVVDAEGAM